jgi:NAD(P)H-dependent flavin oxidoreductase YrpB (nitropropane dioxygenase family)
MGASGVWVGTRFVLTHEAGAPQAHKDAIRTAGFDDNIRTLIFTGRPLRVRNNPYINDWEVNRQDEIKALTSKGIIPYEADLEKLEKEGGKKINPILDAARESSDEDGADLLDKFRPWLMGKAAAVCNEQKSAKEVVDEFVDDACTWLGKVQRLQISAKL